MRASAPTAVPTVPTLSEWQVTALRRYASDFDRAHHQSAKRIEAAEALRDAKAAMSGPQFAVIDFVAGRGWTVRALAERTGRNPDDLASLLAAGATRLARHYEAI